MQHKWFILCLQWCLNDGHTDDRAITVLDRTSKEATFDQIAQEFGFPLVIRPSFTLGGSGASFVFHKEDSLLCHKIEMWSMFHKFPFKEIRCPDEQEAIRHLKLKSL